MKSFPLRRSLAFLAAATLLAPLAARAKDKPIFELTDPRGDDHGFGSLVYPDNASDYGRGELDIVGFSARHEDGGTWFTATMASRVRKPERRAIDYLGTQLDTVAKLGFYNFNIDIYIDMDRQPGSGGYRTVPGRRVEIAPDSAWERAVILTPRPDFARSELKRSMTRALKAEMKRKDSRYGEEEAQKMLVSIPDEVESHVFFPTLVRVLGQKIDFFVPDEFLGGPASADWGYTVFVTASDLQVSLDLAGKVGLLERDEERLLILPVTHGRPQDMVGGGHEDDPLQPPILDLIVPPGESQEKVLSDYSVQADRRVQLHAVVPSKAAATPARP